MALNLAPFGRWTLRDKAAQRPLALCWASYSTHNYGRHQIYRFGAKAKLKTVREPSLSCYEMDLAQALDPKTVDERIARLDQIRTDLTGAIDAVTELQQRPKTIRRKPRVSESPLSNLSKTKLLRRLYSKFRKNPCLSG